MSELTIYGDISPRNAGLEWATLLTRISQLLVLERWAEVRTLPTKSTKTIIMRRYNTLSVSVVPLSEGRTPVARKVTVTDIPVTVQQYGDLIRISDQVGDTHPDPIITEYSDIMAQNMAETQETLYFNVAKAGTTVLFGNNVANRAAVASVLSRGDLRQMERTLDGQNAKMFTQILAGTPKVGTEPVPATYWAYGHTDLRVDLKNVTNFTEAHEYSNIGSLLPGEVGSGESFRFVLSTLAEQFEDAGNASGADSTFLSTSGALNDVYPIICFAKRAWSVVPLKGANSGRIIVLNPKPAPGDELGQRGSIGWKFYNAAIITQDLHMGRIEVAASKNPS